MMGIKAPHPFPQMPPKPKAMNIMKANADIGDRVRCAECRVVVPDFPKPMKSKRHEVGVVCLRCAEQERIGVGDFIRRPVRVPTGNKGVTKSKGLL